MNSDNPVKGTYFPHIDGIRTIAVLSVVVYHICASLCPGGYVGVDIFFVLSGYLITGGIIKSLENNKYSLQNFYTKRIRRIIPAYLVLVIFVMFVSIFIYGGGMLNSIFKTVCFSAAFSTNIYFWMNSGYFSLTAESNPLLHLWSLGVEEQFYIFIPIIISFLFKHKTKWIFPVILLLALGSFALSVACPFFHRDTFNFFMLPTRAWELLAGSLLALSRYSNPSKKSNSIFATLGLLFCLFPCYLYNSNSVFPGVTALPLIIGAVLLIKFGNQGIVGAILQSKPFVFIGKISYSLYLWHWPLIVIWNYLSDHSLNPYGLSAVFAMSVLFGFLSWKYVEMPIRLMKKWNFHRALTITTLGSFGLIIISIACVKMDFLNIAIGGSSKYPRDEYWVGSPSKLIKQIHLPDKENQIPESFVVLGKDENPQYVLWGDSHAKALSPGFNNFSFKTGINGIYIYRCQMPMKNIETDYHPDNNNCVNKVLAWLKTTNIKCVVLSARWAGMIEGCQNEYPYKKGNYKFLDRTIVGSHSEKMKKSLISLCEEIKSMDKSIIIISSIPELGFDAYEYFVKSNKMTLFKFPSLFLEDFNSRQKNTNQIFNCIENKGLAKVIYVSHHFFNNSNEFSPMKEGKLLYIDDDHMSPFGANWLLDYLQMDLISVIKGKTSHLTSGIK